MSAGDIRTRRLKVHANEAGNPQLTLKRSVERPTLDERLAVAEWLASPRVMPNSTLKNASCITAYVVGSVLTFFGVMWFLVQIGTQIQRGTQMPFLTHFSRYALTVLFAAGGVITCMAVLREMPVSTGRKVRRMTAYLFGSVLFCLGVMGLLIELGKGMPSSKNFAGYVIAAVLVACGALTCIAVRLHYGGGLWSLLGLLFVAAGTVRLVSSTWQMELQGRHLISPDVPYATTAALCGVGFYCLCWGHFRRRREKKNYLNETG